MGIRFCCPNGHKLHVKAFLAGKRGICPECGAKVEIPEESVIVMATGCQRSQAGSKKAEQTSRPKEAGDEVSWFVRTSTGDQYGPATNRTLQNWISQGRVSSDCLIWRAGWDQWRPAVTALGQQPSATTGPIPRPTPIDAPAKEKSDQLAAIETDTVAPLRRDSKRRSLTLVYVLLAACMLLLFPLIYIVTVKS